MQLTVIEKPNGVILYRGPSMIDGMPIVVIATGLRDRSKNTKTGSFIQTYILSDNGERPTDALASGQDRSVCGDCIHRKADDGWGTCYVNVGQGPNMIYGALLRGSYPVFKAEDLQKHFGDAIVRLGAYGDPAAVPVAVWSLILSVASGWTGYTHQWRKCDPALKMYTMASCETVRQRRKALAAGWKVFRVRNEDEALEKGEFDCPASKEQGKRLTCEECLACYGGEWKGQATPSIKAHGMAYKVVRFRKMQKMMRNKKVYRKIHASVAPKTLA